MKPSAEEVKLPSLSLRTHPQKNTSTVWEEPILREFYSTEMSEKAQMPTEYCLCSQRNIHTADCFAVTKNKGTT